MDYLLILFFQFIGFCSFQLPVLKIIDSKSSNDTFGDVLKAFWDQDRITVIGSIVILFFQEVVHFTLWYYDSPLQTQEISFGLFTTSYIFATFLYALVLGFAGQAILYGFLGKTGEFIKNKFGSK